VRNTAAGTNGNAINNASTETAVFRITGLCGFFGFVGKYHRKQIQECMLKQGSQRLFVK